MNKSAAQFQLVFQLQDQEVDAPLCRRSLFFCRCAHFSDSFRIASVACAYFHVAQTGTATRKALSTAAIALTTAESTELRL